MKILLVYDPVYGGVLGGGEIAFRYIAQAIFDLFSPKIAEIYIPFVIKDAVSIKYLNSLEDIGWHVNTKYLPLAVKAIFKFYQLRLHKLYQHFDTRDYDLVFTNGAFLAHTIKVFKPTIKVTYINTPARAWFNLPYNKAFFRKLLPSWGIDLLNFYYRKIDVAGLQDNTSKVLAISKNVALRIFSFYNIYAEVVYPPIKFNLKYSDDVFNNLTSKLNVTLPYFVHVSRLEKYKNIDILLDAYAARPIKVPTLILGTGRFGPYFYKRAYQLFGKPKVVVVNNVDGQKIKALRFSNLIFLGYVQETVRNALVKYAHASLVLNNEDLGLNKIEALLLQTPYLGCRNFSTLEFAPSMLKSLLIHPCTAYGLANLLIRYSQEPKIKINKDVRTKLLKQFSLDNFKLQLRKHLCQVF